MRSNIDMLYHSVIDVQSQSNFKMQNFKVSIFESTGLKYYSSIYDYKKNFLRNTVL